MNEEKGRRKDTEETMKREDRVRTDEQAQIHVLEAFIAALLFFGALQVGVSLIPDSQTTTGLDTLSITGEDILRTLYYLPPGDINATAYDNSSLVYFVTTGLTSNLTGFLNSTLDASISYSLSYWTDGGGDPVPLFAMIQTVDENVVSHFLFFHEGTLYDVRLILWREPRGVIP